MSTHSSIGRAALALGAFGVLSPVFALTTSSNNNFVLMKTAAIFVFPVLGLLTIVGVLLGNRIVILTAGAGFAVAALLQLVQFGHATNWLGGNGSTFSLLLALGVGLLTLAALGPTDTPPSSTERTNRWT